MVVLGKHGEAVQHPHPQSVRIPTKFWCDSCSGVHNSLEEDFSTPDGRRSTLCISYLNCMCPSDRKLVSPMAPKVVSPLEDVIPLAEKGAVRAQNRLGIRYEFEFTAMIVSQR